jgi:hypothetical protein
MVNLISIKGYKIIILQIKKFGRIDSNSGLLEIRTRGARQKSIRKKHTRIQSNVFRKKNQFRNILQIKIDVTDVFFI